MSGVISLDDISSSGNDGSSSDSENNGAGDFAELREACEAIGADAENAIERIKSDGGIAEDDVLDFARELADDDELWDLQEEYRMMTDQHRIKQNHLLDAEKDFTEWSSAFYGNSDDPADGTYNDVQQRSRDANGNLFYYKALFPEPHMEHWPGDNAVVWQERPDDDSDIFVTEEYVEEYGDFTLEIDGKERPVPPWDGADTSGSSSGDDAIDPRDMTNDEVRDIVGDLSEDELESLLEVEKATKNRKGAKSAIRDELDRRESSNDDSDDVDELAEVLRENGIGSADDLKAALE